MAVLLPEVLDTIRDYAEPLTVSRPDAEAETDGYVTVGSSPVAGVEGHMQPMSDKELRLVPEGMNTLEWWNIWTLQEIKERDRINDSASPVVQVQKLKHWKEGPFWHAQGVNVDDVKELP